MARPTKEFTLAKMCSDCLLYREKRCPFYKEGMRLAKGWWMQFCPKFKSNPRNKK